MGILCQSLAGGTLKMKTVALLSLIPGSPTAMVWATTAMDTPAPMDTTADGTARGLPSPSPRLMPTPTCCTADTVWDTTATGPTATPTLTATTARGPLRPSPRP